MAAVTPRISTPAKAGAAAAAGLVGGVVLGARTHRDSFLGVRIRSRGSAETLAREIGRAARAAAVAGRRLGELDEDLRAVHEQAEQSRRQSPIEVVLSALTSRRLPRHS